MQVTSSSFLDYSVLNIKSKDLKSFCGNLLDSNKKTIVNTINPHSYAVAKKTPRFRRSLLLSNYLLPDGIGVSVLASLLNLKGVSKIAGMDYFKNTMDILNERKGKVFLLGSTDDVLEKLRKNVNEEWPNVSVGSFSPSYCERITDDENFEIINRINEFLPDVLFVGMTAPKQEIWIDEHYKDIKSKIFSGVGAVFDFYAGTVERPNKYFVALGLEWLVRLLGEPKRLWKRTFISVPIMLFDVLKYMFKRR